MDPREYQYIFMGFTAAWVILVAYVTSIVLRERRLRRELDRVRRMVEDSGKKG
jgi:CcmD family protein